MSFFRFANVFRLSVLSESNIFFFFVFFFLSVSHPYFSEMKLILNKLTSFYSDVLSLFFSSILILLMCFFSLVFVYLAMTQITL